MPLSHHTLRGHKRDVLPFALKACVGIVMVAVSFTLIAGCVRWGMLPWKGEENRRAVCRSNLRLIGLAMKIYAMDWDGSYPWDRGSAEPEDAWCDMVLVFPAYLDDFGPFLCPSSTDEPFSCCSSHRRDDLSGAASDVKVVIVQHESFEPRNTKEVISYSYCYDSRKETKTAWTEDAPDTVRLAADKKASIKIKADDIRRASHRGEGRNVLYLDMHGEWKAGINPLDPDEDNDKIGAPDADDYTDWWSDPPWYGEGM